MATTVTKQSISAAAADKAIRACEAKAKEIGVPMCIAVCDESGVLKAFTRMDGAALLSIQLAQDKAYTAVGFGMPTDQWYPSIKDDGPLALGAPKVDPADHLRRRLSRYGGWRRRRGHRRERRPLHPGYGSGEGRTGSDRVRRHRLGFEVLDD